MYSCAGGAGRVEGSGRADSQSLNLDQYAAVVGGAGQLVLLRPVEFESLLSNQAFICTTLEATTIYVIAIYYLAVYGVSNAENENRAQIEMRTADVSGVSVSRVL
jgi:hypothetical protein